MTGVLVNFIGDNSQYTPKNWKFPNLKKKKYFSAQLNLDKIGKFWENYSVHGNNIKHKKLAESVEIAKKILKGETTYEYERDRLAETQVIFLWEKREIRKNNQRKAKRKKKSTWKRRIPMSQILVKI